MIDNAFASTPEEIHGTPVGVGGADFLLKGMNDSNRAFMVKATELKISGKDFGSALAKDMPEILADSLVMGWSGLVLEDKEVSYSRDTAVEVFTQHPKLASAVFEAASVIGAEEAEVLEDDIEALGKP